MNSKPTTKQDLRERRRARIRAAVNGTADKPRLAVFRSNRFISAQLIDDVAGRTLASAHGRAFNTSAGGTASGRNQAKKVGEAIAEAAKAHGIKTAVFDRAGYRYAGQVQALAEAVREAGLVM